MRIMKYELTKPEQLAWEGRSSYCVEILNKSDGCINIQSD